MNDHELLELAAKAAGYDKAFETLGVCDLSGSWTKYVKNRQYINGREHLTYWNPLIDDGDALRLANAKHMVIDFESGTVLVEIESNWRTFDYTAGDIASLKLAIVRAAAEIGKGIP